MKRESLCLQPSELERTVRAEVSDICRSFGEGYQRAKADAGLPVSELWHALGAAGWLLPHISTEWGGRGMGLSALVWILEECARSGNGGFAMVASSSMSATILDLHGTDEQKRQWLPGMATGTMKFAFGITEPDAGTNTHRLRTALRREGNDYVLSGQKYYVSGVEDAQALIVAARMRNDDGTLGKLALCLIETDAPGFTHQIIRMPYIAAEEQRTLFFDDVHVPAAQLIGGEAGGMRVLFQALNPERLVAATVSIGNGLRALDKVQAWTRAQGEQVRMAASVAEGLARCKIELDAAKLLVAHACAMFEAGIDDGGHTANTAKYMAAEACIHTVDAAVQACGMDALLRGDGVSDQWWLARMMRIAPVSAEMVLNHVAQHALGLPRSY